MWESNWSGKMNCAFPNPKKCHGRQPVLNMDLPATFIRAIINLRALAIDAKFDHDFFFTKTIQVFNDLVLR